MRKSEFLGLGQQGFHRIVYSEWGDPANTRIVICVHGLTRNRRDFDFLARHLADEFRVVCMDVVGRGESDWLANSGDYTFSQYQRDAAALVARVTAPAPLGWFARLFPDAGYDSADFEIDWVGTSMGGLIGMLFAAQPKSPIRRLVLNDVGPLVPWSGLVRLKGHAGGGKRFATLAEVEAFLRDVCSPFGRLSNEQWAHLAKHGAQQELDGSYALRYNPELLRTLRSGGALEGPRGERFLEGVDLWPVWDALRCRILALRGAESDVLTQRTAREMEGRGPRARVIEIPAVGHAPALMDIEQVEPIRRFLLEQDRT